MHGSNTRGFVMNPTPVLKDPAPASLSSDEYSSMNKTMQHFKDFSSPRENEKCDLGTSEGSELKRQTKKACFVWLGFPGQSSGLAKIAALGFFFLTLDVSSSVICPKIPPLQILTIAAL